MYFFESVHPEKVRQALLYLKHNNSLYSDITNIPSNLSYIEVDDMTTDNSEGSCSTLATDEVLDNSVDNS